MHLIWYADIPYNMLRGIPFKMLCRHVIWDAAGDYGGGATPDPIHATRDGKTTVADCHEDFYTVSRWRGRAGGS